MDGLDEGTAPGERLDRTAALVRAECIHLDATLQALVNRLSAAPGLKVSVRHRHGRLRKLIGDVPYLNDLHRNAAPIQKLVVAPGPCSYWLEADHGSIRCWTELTSSDRGRVTEELPFGVWATKLFDEIATRNLVNYESLAALRHLVVHDRVD